MTEKNQIPYTEAASTGQYVRKSGLSGKYDNVRRFWEDDVTRLFLRSYLKEIVDEKARKLERLKILDLGCGAGDGYDLLTGITAKDVGIYEYAVTLINEDLLGFYKGIDLNIDLISRAVEIYGSNNKVVFTPGDISAGLDIEDEPFDVYFSSYGTMSHFTSEQMIKLLSDIAVHSEDGALVVLDWLGRYAYEWQDLWSLKTNEETFMDYRISYIYPPEERDSVDIQSFPLKLLSEREVMEIVRGAEAISGTEIKVQKFFDRSVFVGRHMDTGDYNRHCTPVRETVNSLLEPNIRTDLTSLIVDYVPRHGFTELNRFFEKFTMSWNTLVKHTIEFLAEYEENSGQAESSVDLYKFYPESLRNAVETMQKVVNTTGALPGDSRANIIEPQLAYALRRLEMELQSGVGMGHGLVGILKINGRA
jgi:SAM-dependent methyltransferase